MNKNKKAILIILGIGMFFALPVFANGNLTIDFENDPLFNEANFLPNESITRWAKVTNNSGQTERIAVEAINVNDSNGFGNALTLEIKEGNNRLYNGPLSQFFNAGEVYLSDLSEGSQTQYDFSIIFYPEAGNTFQGVTLGFDILIGFQGTGGGLAPGGGGGGGGFLPPGLTIAEPITEIEITETSVMISWTTSYKATSEVVYGSELENHTFDLSAVNYGYEHTSGEDTDKVITHTVTITGLDPDTTYYYRCVSHGSLAVTTEYSFTTLGSGEPGEVFIEQEPGNIEQTGKENVQGGGTGTDTGTGTGTGTGDMEEENIDEEIIEPPVFNEAVIDSEDSSFQSGGFLATSGGLFSLGNLPWLLFALIIIILGLLFFSIKKKEKTKNKLFLISLITILLAVLCYLLSFYYWLIILVLAILIILFLLFKTRKKEEEN